jgi:circadian clock protein KaiB
MNQQHREPAAESKDQHYVVLRLFVAGTTPNSLRAIQNVRLICEERLPGRHELEVIDVFQHAGQLAAGQVVVAPTLVRESPLPVRRWIGGLTNRNRVLEGLDIIPPAVPE